MTDNTFEEEVLEDNPVVLRLVVDLLSRPYPKPLYGVR